MSLLFGKPPKMSRESLSARPSFRDFKKPVQFENVDEFLVDAIDRVLQLPSVASKSFLITIGDRSVTGLVCREQMVGPWQVPVADCAVTSTSYTTLTGESLAMGERPLLALNSAAASARMAVAESLTNLMASSLAFTDANKSLERVCLSANWMANASADSQGAALYDAVQAIAIEICPQLGIPIPVGKDSMSMKTQWTDEKNVSNTVTSPMSLVVTAYGAVNDVRKTWTP